MEGSQEGKEPRRGDFKLKVWRDLRQISIPDLEGGIETT